MLCIGIDYTVVDAPLGGDSEETLLSKGILEHAQARHREVAMARGVLSPAQYEVESPQSTKAPLH